jgi:hypothetical protein
MEGSFKAQGSFGIPEHVKREMEAVRKRVPAAEAEAKATQPHHPRAPAPEKVNEPEPTPTQELSKELAPEEAKQKTAEETEYEELVKRKNYWEKQLEIEITGEDLQDYLFKGRIIKDGIYLTSYKVKGAEKDFRVKLQSLNPNDSTEIDEKMAAFRDKGKYTAAGIDNEQALVTLSYGLLAADGRPLGKTPDERYKNICQFGGLTVNMLASAWKGFNYLLDYALQEKKLLKK